MTNSDDPAPRPDAQISAHLLLRIMILLIAIWSGAAGIVLIAFHGASSGALAAGVRDETARRLIGAHILLLVPVYLLIAWRYDRYLGLTWLPFAAQLAVVLIVGYGMITGATGFSDGILAFAVSLIFVVLFGFLWVTQQRAIARSKMEADAEAIALEDGGRRDSGRAGSKPG